MIDDYFRIALRNITHRRLRAWLTMIGIFIGIATVVALISISQGMEAAVNEQFEKLGTDKVIVTPGGEGALGPGLFSGSLLKNKDLDVVKSANGVDKAAELFYKTGRVTFKKQTKTTFIIGFPTDDTASVVTDMQGFEAEKGRDLKSGDKNKMLVGWRLWNQDFFDKSVSLRDNLEIEGEKFEVVGLIKRVGNPQDDAQVYMPIDTARKIFDSEEISAIYVQVTKGYNPTDVAEKIREDLRKSRNEEKGEESFQVQTFEQLMQQIGTVLGIIRVVLVGIAAISLVVGGIGIMNTMYTAVIERTREIGIMKAIGAKNSDIMLVFLLESGIYGLVGGLVGVITGLGLSIIIQKIASAFIGTGLFKVYISAWLIIGALTFSFVIGTVSGVLPAKQASSLKPVDALRYE